MRLQRQTVRVETLEGPMEADALVWPNSGLALTPVTITRTMRQAHDERWCITHLASGCRLGGWYSYTRARRILSVLVVSAVDWRARQPRPSAQVYAQMRDLLNR